MTSETRTEFLGTPHARGAALLLRDLDSPQGFISLGPWANMVAVRSWRGLAGYKERVARPREVLDGFEPRTLEIVARR
jgi:hypothetical protein